MKSHLENDKIILELEGRIDSMNASAVEKEIFDIIGDYDGRTPEFNAAKLDYISSAGLRVLMKVCKKYKEKLKVSEASPEVYDIFETTGFNSFMDVEKRLREISVEGCDVIGEGGNGIVYRLNPETIVKVYYGERNSIEKIKRSQEATRDAFLHGVPTTIAFDMVKVGDSYGVVYEMINAKSLVEEINEHPDKLDFYGNMIADTLIKMHSTEFKKGDLPDSKANCRNDIDATVEAGYFTKEEADRVYKLVDDIPERCSFVHQDFHPGNMMLQDGEIVLIDVDDSGIGHPIFDLSAMYLVYVVAAKSGWTKKHQGLGGKEFLRLWDIIVKKYFGTEDPDKLKEIDRILDGYTKIKYIRSLATSPRVPRILRGPLVKSAKKKFFKTIDTLHAIPE